MVVVFVISSVSVFFEIFPEVFLFSFAGSFLFSLRWLCAPVEWQ